MLNVILENLVNVAAALLVMLIGVAGTWLSLKIGKREELKTVAQAQQEVITMAQITVGELQQTMVEGLKAASADGKLTKKEIGELSYALLARTMEKLSKPSHELLNAAGVDLVALIQGAGEDWINQMKERA